MAWALVLLKDCGEIAQPTTCQNNSPCTPLQQAQTLNAQGQVSLSNDQPETALDYGQRAENQYQTAADQPGI